MLVAQSFGIVDKNNKFVICELTEQKTVDSFNTNKKLKTGIYYFATINHYLSGKDITKVNDNRKFIVL